MTDKQPKKVVRKHVKVKQYETVKKNLAKSRYNKFQLWIAKLFKLELLDTYQYLFRVEYFGSTRLNVNDIVFNSTGQIFVVIREQNRLAMLVSKDSWAEKPNMYGTLTILDK
tara:strand:+ start:7468 stop:7803 length:336 start_codon:yes stop_codon:yes gene_type:complete